MEKIEFSKITKNGAIALLSALEKKSIFERGHYDNEVIMRLRILLK